MRGVILAAGNGLRLRPLTLDTPKGLLEIAGLPLIHYPIEALHAAGVRDIAVIVGHQARQFEEALLADYPGLEFFYNEDFDGGNALSVYAARDFVTGGPFVVCMADHVICPDITSMLLSEDRGGCTLCVDAEASLDSQVNDGTRVMVDRDGYISTIGKELQVWNAMDTGVFQMNDDVFTAIDALRKSRGLDVSITDTVRLMGTQGEVFSTCDVSGKFWADVDTLDDYRSVEELLEGESWRDPYMTDSSPGI